MSNEEEAVHLTDDEGVTETAIEPVVHRPSAAEEGAAAAKLRNRRSTLVNIPGMQESFKLKKQGSSSQGKSQSAKKALIMTLDGTEIIIDCPNGRYTNATELLTLLYQQKSMPEEDGHLFGLWVVSASLQLQLKPHHLPFKILKKWHDILESLATGDTYSEEPTMYWKKDALTHQAVEKKVSGPLAMRLLYDELAFNVQYSFYPATLAEAIHMAALALKVAKADAGTKTDISDVFGCAMPPHLESGTWGWTWRRKVWKAYTAIAKEAGDKKAWRQKYLGAGRKWNYYGATFFYGGLEHETPGSPDHIVRVGINLDGVHVIEDHTNTVRLSLGYDEFSYNSYESADEDDSFLIEYEGTDQKKHHMIVWSPQANMMDNLVTRYIEVIGNFKEHLKERKAARKSFKPVPAGKGKSKKHTGEDFARDSSPARKESSSSARSSTAI